ncbi:MAG: TrbI/VirB10 family protein [Elusimicrobia bacterium]|nr:TrbI/VirB10 family protein [Elusimicrobiota bacterium]
MKKMLLVLSIVCCSNLFCADWNGPTEKHETKMRYFMHTGFTFDAVLKTAIFSFNTISPVIAQTEYDISFLGKVIIPKYTKLIGSCNIEKSVDRVNVVFHTIVFPDGQEIKFMGLALHTDGSGGIPGKVNKQKARLPAKILLSAAATGASVASGNDIPAQMIKGIADDTQQEMAGKQDYSITIKKDIAIQIYVVDRLEY